MRDDFNKLFVYHPYNFLKKDPAKYTTNLFNPGYISEVPARCSSMLGLFSHIFYPIFYSDVTNMHTFMPSSPTST